MGIAQNVLCSFCNLEMDSIQGWTLWCQHVKFFWNDLEEFIYDHCDNIYNFQVNGEKSAILTLISKLTMFLIWLYYRPKVRLHAVTKKNLKQSWLPAFWKKIQNTRGSRECFLIGHNRTKCANFRGSPLFPSYVQHKKRKTNNQSTSPVSVWCWLACVSLTLVSLCQFDVG